MAQRYYQRVIMLDDEMWNELDRLARESGESRSSILRAGFHVLGAVRRGDIKEAKRISVEIT